MASLSYKEKLLAIKSYTNLGINSSKIRAKNPNFTKSEKWLISRYYNLARESGYFDYNKYDNEFIPKVKFVKGKKKQKGGPKFSGYFIKGADPGDKVIGNKIIKTHYEKIQIPMDFSEVELFNYDDDEYSAGDDYDTEMFDRNDVEDIILAAIEPYYDDLEKGNYFTIYLENGWELGQRKGKQVKKSDRRDGQAIAKDLSGQRKLKNLTEKIIEQLRYGFTKYKMGTLALVAGVYLWKFKNQRKPNKKELKAIKGKRKRK